MIFLDANESTFNAPLNRYPRQAYGQLVAALSPLKQVDANRIFLSGDGTCGVIDMLMRVCCTESTDNIVVVEPTRRSYSRVAQLCRVEYRSALLRDDFSLDSEKVFAKCDSSTRMIVLCSPNNPTGNVLQRDEIERLLQEFDGLVVVDESYSDFSTHRPFRLDLDRFANLVVVNSLSKACGLAAAGVGILFASSEIVSQLERVAHPNRISLPVATAVLDGLSDVARIYQNIVMVRDARASLADAFEGLPFCRKVFHSDANFFLLRFDDADAVYDYLLKNDISVSKVSDLPMCDNCLRISIGRHSDNEALLKALRQM